MRLILVVGIEDDDAKIWPRFDRAADEQGHGGRLAHAGGSHHREMSRDHLVDVDLGGNAAVLAQPADLHPSLPSKRIDGSQIVRPHPVHNRPEGRVRTNAAVKIRLTTIDDLSTQLECDPSEVGLSFRPLRLEGRDFADHPDHTRIAMADGYQVTDGPILAVRIKTTVDDSLGPVQRHQASDDPGRRNFSPLGNASFVEDRRACPLPRDLRALRELLSGALRRVWRRRRLARREVHDQTIASTVAVIHVSGWRLTNNI